MRGQRAVDGESTGAIGSAGIAVAREPRPEVVLPAVDTFRGADLWRPDRGSGAGDIAAILVKVFLC